MPGRQITDHQMELYMTNRKTDRRALARGVDQAASSVSEAEAAD